ncbi:aldehyde dehydrogenase family protein [Paenarthrobacter sp. PH39-S1]|uniref:aldehyde dehydrogenase family protein n=1 Tax=Paenarthrobacter sp. PH39-S1 TaxID=3046204 RepID=UPI0024BAECD6|nr:aldehyde dehydrogenase family protein [Paenarthrobacter sp. PH39-S1]MDJ0358056.1 aldehyde dehydrogenase family protein [Paenarthrobacter sp. PH39-S1]
MSIATDYALPEVTLRIGSESRSIGVAFHEHVNPATGQRDARVPLAGSADVDDAVQAAHQAFSLWRTTPARQRGRALLKLADLVEEHAGEFAALAIADNGTPQATAHASVAAAAEWIRYYGGWADKLPLGRITSVVSAGGSFGHTLRQLYGVIGAIITWNAPLMSLAMKVPAALAAGNTVVVKPSELTPFSAMLFADLVRAAGIPDGVFNVVPGGAEAGAALVDHPLVKKVTFTGGPETARKITAAAARTFKPVLLELGGKSANLVFADADLDAAARHSTFMAFGVMSGQACALPTRLLVQDSIYDAFVAKVADIAASFKVGNPEEADTVCGPVINQGAIDRVEAMVARAQEEGARVVTGGARAGGELAEGFYYPPTILADVDPSSELAHKEVFGPVLAVIRFTDEAQALALANDTDYGLSGYIWTSDARRAIRLTEQLETGEVVVNGAPNAVSERPFGGIGHSGNGNEGGLEGLEEFFWTKSVAYGDG